MKVVKAKYIKEFYNKSRKPVVGEFPCPFCGRTIYFLKNSDMDRCLRTEGVLLYKKGYKYSCSGCQSKGDNREDFEVRMIKPIERLANEYL